ncbi:hypothetical protein EYF80_048220 [Liparis tanakae]|uniref:Uncharacterized protein n=1 Tax=Liparis tanakae TaxID=230148 RepID=A0A4Z2FL20_9TELE|nr:hypothetical protein EYF80_048220 [Liparis tanakae]
MRFKNLVMLQSGRKDAEQSLDSVALRSPWVNAPCKEGKPCCEIRFPDSPNCWMALSALHGSSKVMWTRRRWFFTRLSACREIPELAASEMMATNWETEGLG